MVNGLTTAMRQFLAAFSKSGSPHMAAKCAGVSVGTHYVWMSTRPRYKEAFLLAQDEANDYLEREARRRAIEGWREPVYQQGMLVGYKTKYSDPLHIELLRANNPEKFKPRVVTESTNRNMNANVNVNANIDVDYSKLSPDELWRLDTILGKLAEDAPGRADEAPEGAVQPPTP